MLTYSIGPLIPGIVFVILTALVTIFFFLNKEQKKISLKMFIIYTVCALLAFVLVGLIGFAPVENALSYFTLLQAIFYCSGWPLCCYLLSQ